MVPLLYPLAFKVSLAAFGGVSAVAVYKAYGGSRGKTVNDVFAACGLCNVGRDGKPQPWNVKKVSKQTNGVRLVMRFPFGKTLSDVTKKADAINTALGVDCAFARDGSYLVLDVPQHPLPSYISFSEKMLGLTRGNWKVIVGANVMGEWLLHDFDKRPHLLVAGQTRFGKSEALKAIICTLLLSHDSSELEFVGVDMKPAALEFRKFSGLWTELAAEPVDFLNVIIEAQKDIRKRADTLAQHGCSNVKEYELVTGKKFKRRFVVVDEYGKSFGSDWEKEIAQEMMQLVAMGAGLGVHVILCTQRPDADVIDGKIRANIGSIICLPVSTPIQSRVVLGHEGAELLPEIPGRAIYHAFGKEEIVQIPYISDWKLKRILPSKIPAKPGSGDWKPFQASSGGVVDDYGT